MIESLVLELREGSWVDRLQEAEDWHPRVWAAQMAEGGNYEKVTVWTPLESLLTTNDTVLAGTPLWPHKTTLKTPS